ncbi:MAG: hypothetical protein ACI9V8_000161 [Urechidicola sp.]
MTESQKIQLSSLTDDILELVGEIKETKKGHKLIVQQFLFEPTLDQAKVLDMVCQISQMINDKATETIVSLAYFLGSLDTDQKAELQGFVEKNET